MRGGKRLARVTLRLTDREGELLTLAACSLGLTESQFARDAITMYRQLLDAVMATEALWPSAERMRELARTHAQALTRSAT